MKSVYPARSLMLIASKIEMASLIPVHGNEVDKRNETRSRKKIQDDDAKGKLLVSDGERRVKQWRLLETKSSRSEKSRRTKEDGRKKNERGEEERFCFVDQLFSIEKSRKYLYIILGEVVPKGSGKSCFQFNSSNSISIKRFHYGVYPTILAGVER